ncbi:MAG: hypothetical protein WBG36_00845 [Ornithinimicrobium sp.]
MGIVATGASSGAEATGASGRSAETSGASILVVCTGNVCRSPYLEYLLRDRLDQVWGSRRMTVRSAGVRGLVGEPMTGASAGLLKAEGIDSADFRARRVSPQDLKGADLVICATRAHRSAVVQLVPALLRRAVLLPELALAHGHLPEPPAVSCDSSVRGADGAEVTEDDLSSWLRCAARAVVTRRPTIVTAVPPDELDIDDPYGGTEEAYDRMRRQIERWLPDAVAAISPTTDAEQIPARRGR